MKSPKELVNEYKDEKNMPIEEELILMTPAQEYAYDVKEEK